MIQERFPSSTLIKAEMGVMVRAYMIWVSYEHIIGEMNKTNVTKLQLIPKQKKHALNIFWLRLAMKLISVLLL
jgi:hypothetical protein